MGYGYLKLPTSTVILKCWLFPFLFARYSVEMYLVHEISTQTKVVHKRLYRNLIMPYAI